MEEGSTGDEDTEEGEGEVEEMVDVVCGSELLFVVQYRYTWEL